MKKLTKTTKTKLALGTLCALGLLSTGLYVRSLRNQIKYLKDHSKVGNLLQEILKLQSEINRFSNGIKKFEKDIDMWSGAHAFGKIRRRRRRRSKKSCRSLKKTRCKNRRRSYSL